MIAIGNDHGGFKLKEEIKKYLDEKNIEYKDFGSMNEERTDYPIYAAKVAEAIQNKECDLGILLCRSGHGMTIFAKSDDNINVITLGGDYLTVNDAICIIRNWLGTEFKGGRYEERLKMIEEIEKQNMK